MNNITFTKNQQDAIDSRNGSILVSAAAGSGKTAVLVERVIARITDNKNPTDIDKLLIVTFTNAAANEMKNRINERLYQLIQAQPNNNRLKRQQILLNYAHINTIDSFCSELIKENFYKLSISPNFKIADLAQMSMLKNEAMEKTLEYTYKNANKKFQNLIDIFNFGRDDKKLVETVMILYSHIRSHPFPFRWLDEKLNMINESEDIIDSPWVNEIISYSSQALDYIHMLTKQNLDLCEIDEQLYKAYYKTILSDLKLIEDLQQNLYNQKWDYLQKKFSNISFDKLKIVRNCDNSATKELIQKNRKTVKDIVNKRLSCLYENTNSENIEDFKSLKKIAQQLFHITKIFYDNLEKTKKENNVLDFSDLLHKSLNLMLIETKDGYEKTPFAYELSNNFDEILVDEYQDINAAQNMLFYALSNDGDNIFTVGDAKQSIYRFRHAKPEIFIKNKENLNIYQREIQNYPAKIILDKNFRSRDGILKLVNFVFSKLMSKDSSDIDYNEEEQLKFGANYYKENNGPDTQLHLIEVENECSEEKTILEAKVVAEKILEIMQQGKIINDGKDLREATYGDFCILLRNPKNKAKIFADVLESYGIATYTETEKDFFSLTEIKTTFSLLKVIDNPMHDVPLLSVLYSPMYGFTTDELSEIRLHDDQCSIYFSLCNYSKKEDYLAEKCRNFLTDIDYFRKLSVGLSTDKLINTILEKTDYFSIVKSSNNGTDKIKNLRLFINYAKEYESSSFKGLGNFVSYLDRLIAQGINLLNVSQMSDNLNLVKIISIHKSKGLEFPICFLCDCSAPFHSIKEDIIINTDLGVALKLLNKNTKTLYSTLAREALLIKEKKENISEELRLLYVAMTRAKEKLIITSTVKNAKQKAAQLNCNTKKLLPPFFVLSQNCYTNWFLAAFSDKILSLNCEIPDINKFEIFIINQANKESTSITSEAEEIKISYEIDNKLKNLLIPRFNFEYKNKLLKDIPSKLSVTQLSVKNSTNTFLEPAFIKQEQISNVEKGVALHTFMQFADFNKARHNLEKEITQLTNSNKLSNEKSKSLDRNQIKKFLDSKLCDRIINSKEIYKEFNFKILISPSEINENKWKNLTEKMILLRGSIDLLFREEKQLVIVDYKNSKCNSVKELLDRYSKQLKMYKIAAKQIFNTKDVQCNIYSFYLSQNICID